MRFTLFILSLVLAVAAFPAQAKMYKWVDEQGQIHFGDKIPLKYIGNEHHVLDHRGLVIKHHEAAKTPEQILDAKRLEKERKKAALIKKKQKQRDRVLLDTFTTVRDLVLARDSRLDSIDAQIQLSDSIIADSSRNLVSLQQRIADIQTSNREVPVDLHQRITNEKEQVAVQGMVRGKHKKRRQDIAVQFEGYLTRFKELKAKQKVRREELARERDF